MAVSWKLTLDLIVQDLDSPTQANGLSIAEANASVHDFSDPTPMSIATQGAPGAKFIAVPTSVVQIERLIVQTGASADLILRVGGVAPSIEGNVSAPTASLDGKSITIVLDSNPAVTTTFAATDTTLDLVARKINYNMNAPIASVNASNHLVLSSSNTGGADAKASGRSFGLLSISGNALSLLGLTQQDLYGSGFDYHLGVGPHVLRFAATDLPKKLEVSGTAPSVVFWISGKKYLLWCNMANGRKVLDTGDLNQMSRFFASCAIGTMLNNLDLQGALTPVREVVAVASDAATPTYPIAKLLFAEVLTGSTGLGEKTPLRRGSAAAANSAAPNSAGTSVAFAAGEVTGAGATVELVYWTRSKEPRRHSISNAIPALLTDNTSGIV